MTAIILVTYNGEEDLPIFFETLLSSFSDEAVRLYIVDNASQDATRSIIEERAPRARHIFLSENIGYAGGHVRGIEEAMRDGAATVILVNQDMEFASGWIGPLEEYLSKNPTCGAVQPMIALAQEKGLLNSCGNALHYLGFGWSHGYRDPIAACRASDAIGYASGAAVAYRVDALRDVGLFDPEFFMYHEDTDLSWRLRLSGWKCGVEPQSIVYHRYEFGRSEKKFYYIERNRIAILLRNYSARTLLLIAPIFLFMETGMLARAVVISLGKMRVAPLLYFITSRFFWFSPYRFLRLLRQRRSIQRKRRVADRKLISYFSSRIEAQEVDSFIMRVIVNPILEGYWSIIKGLI